MTSANGGEGKTTVVANLGLAMASSGKRVLAISADLRKPSLYAFFPEASRAGLLDVLSGRCDSARRRAGSRSTARARAGGQLGMLATSSRFRDPARLFESADIALILDQAREDYDVILIDAPPLLQTPEASIIAGMADANLVVGRAGCAHARRRAACDGAADTANAKTLGVIVSDARERRASYGYGNEDEAHVTRTGAMSSLAGSGRPVARRLGGGAALAALVLLAAICGVAMGRAPLIVGDAKATLLLPALAVGAVALCLGYVRPLPVLCAGMALLSFARVQPVTPADGALALCMLLTLVGPLRFRPSMPTGPALALTLFTLGTVLSLIEARDTAVALSFELHTLFFVLLAVWLTSVLRTQRLDARGRALVHRGRARHGGPRRARVGRPLPGLRPVHLPNGKRIQGLYLDPNAFAPYLVPAAVICLEDIMRPRLLRWRPSLVVVLVPRARARDRALLLPRRRREPRARLPRHRARVRAAQRPPQVARARRRDPRRLRRVRRGRARPDRRDQRAAAARAGPGIRLGSLLHPGARARQGLDAPARLRPGRRCRPSSRSTPTRRSSGASSRTACWASPRSLLLVGSTIVAAWRSARLDNAREGLGSAALLGCWLGLSFNGLVVDTYHYRVLWLVAALVWVVASAPTSAARLLALKYEWARSRARNERRLNMRMPTEPTPTTPALRAGVAVRAVVARAAF